MIGKTKPDAMKTVIQFNNFSTGRFVVFCNRLESKFDCPLEATQYYLKQSGRKYLMDTLTKSIVQNTYGWENTSKIKVDCASGVWTEC
jgi:hypothetical protein